MTKVAPALAQAHEARLGKAHYIGVMSTASQASLIIRMTDQMLVLGDAITIRYQYQ